MTRIPGDVTRTLDQYTWLVHWTRTLDSYTRDAVLHYYYLHALRITQFKTIFLVYECTLSRTRMEMHQLHQLHGQFMFVISSFKSYQVYQAAFQERMDLFNIVVPYVLSQQDIHETQNPPPVFCNIWLHLFANSTLAWFLSHLLKKTKDAFRRYFPTNGLPSEEWAELVTRKERPARPWVICMLMNWRLQGLSSGTDKLLLCCRWAIPELLP